jgi:hypothetical protein
MFATSHVHAIQIWFSNLLVSDLTSVSPFGSSCSGSRGGGWDLNRSFCNEDMAVGHKAKRTAVTVQITACSPNLPTVRPLPFTSQFYFFFMLSRRLWPSIRITRARPLLQPSLRIPTFPAVSIALPTHTFSILLM